MWNRRPNIQSLARRLLGRTWLVDRLSTALRLSQTAGRGLGIRHERRRIAGGGRHADRWAAAGGGGHAVAAKRAAGMPRTGARLGEAIGRPDGHSCRDWIKSDPNKSRSWRRRSPHIPRLRANWPNAQRQTAACAAKVDRRCPMSTTASKRNTRQTEERIAATASTDRVDLAKNRPRTNWRPSSLKRRFRQASSNCQYTKLQHAREYAAATEQQIALARLEQRAEMLRHQMEQAKRSQQEREQLLAEMRRQLATREAQIVELDEAMRADTTDACRIVSEQAATCGAVCGARGRGRRHSP